MLAITTRSPLFHEHPLTAAAALTANYSMWVATLWAPVLCGAWLDQRRHGQAGLRWLLRTCAVVLLWPVTFLYLVSWILYSRLTYFLDLEGLAFFRHDFEQILAHVAQVEATQLELTTIGAFLLAVGVAWAVDRLRRWPTGRYVHTILQVGASWAALGLLIVLALVVRYPQSPSIRLPQGGIYGQKGLERLRTVTRDHVGPLTALSFDVLWRSSGWGAPAFQLTRIRIHETGEPLVLPRRSHYPLTPRVPAERVIDPMLPREWLLQALTADDKRIVPLATYLRQVPAGAPTRDNVLVILVESLRPDRLRMLGAAREVMPNVDRLAERSMVFTEAYAQSSHSDYADICPFSSQYPLRSIRHHYYERIKYPRVLIYDILKALGYRTAIFSSQNERWGGMLNYLDTGSLDVIFHGGNFRGQTYLSVYDPSIRNWPRNHLRLGKVEDRNTVDAALKWIRKRPSQPFFIYMNLQESHFPYLLPTGVTPTFQPADITFPINNITYPTWATPIMQNRYDNSLRYIDSLLGELFQQLEASGLLDRTIVVLTGDNGEAFYEHDRAMHAGPLWNEAIRVPLMIHAPRHPPALVRGPAQHIDVPPTLLALLRLPPHPAFQGANLLEEARLRNRPLFALAQKPNTVQSAVILNGRKLIQDWTGAFELFDLTSDPRETVNLMTKEPESFRLLNEHLRLWHTLQLRYYASPQIYTRFYPPSIEAAYALVESRHLQESHETDSSHAAP